MAMLNNQMVRQTLIKNPPQNMGTDGRLKEPFGNTVYRIPYTYHRFPKSCEKPPKKKDNSSGAKINFTEENMEKHTKTDWFQWKIR